MNISVRVAMLRFAGTPVAVFILALCHGREAIAYVGPGAGLGVVGAIAGTLLAICALVVGAVWYPLKRLAKRLRGRK